MVYAVLPALVVASTLHLVLVGVIRRLHNSGSLPCAHDVGVLFTSGLDAKALLEKIEIDDSEDACNMQPPDSCAEPHETSELVVEARAIDVRHCEGNLLE